MGADPRGGCRDLCAVCLSHHGVKAREKVTSRAAQLGRRGDTDGEKICRDVAREIEKTPPNALPLSWAPQA